METFVEVHVGSFHLFKAFAISWYMAMLITGHRSTDTVTDAMGNVRRPAIFLDPFDKDVS